MKETESKIYINMVELNNLNKDRKIDKTQATRFLMPLVYTSNSQRKFPFYLRKGIENCYLYSDDSIILVYEITDDNTDLEEKIREDDLFVDSIDIENENKVGYIFKIPEQHIDDVKLFKEGRYSEFSEEMKSAILNFWNLGDNKNNELYGVLYQTDLGKQFGATQTEEGDEFAEGEYWMKPDLNLEQFSNHYKV